MTRFLYIFLILFSNQSLADIYGYIDESDVPHFSDSPDSDRYAFELKTDLDSSISDNQTIKLEFLDASTKSLHDQIYRASKENNLENELLHAVIKIESNYHINAKSPKGAQGLMQLMPATARKMGVINIMNPQENIQGGAKYLRELLSLFNNDLSLALAAYNAGENAVIKYGNKIPPFKETQAYVPKVLKAYNELRRQNKASY